MKLSRTSLRTSAVVAALAVAGILLGSTSARAQWGTIKGQVVWAGGPIPVNKKANVDKDKKDCLAKGDILQNNVVVNAKNKGVRYVLVWLADPKDATNAKFAPKIHPALQKPPTFVEIDQPCCTFEPRVMGMLATQELIVKNSMKISHNFKISSLGDGPQENPLILPNKSFTVKGFVPKMIPTPYSCSIHAWMKGYIGVFAHPYFVVTDADGKFEIKNAPVGKFQLVLWHEAEGFLTQPDLKNKKVRGKVIEITAGKATDAGKIDMKITPE